MVNALIISRLLNTETAMPKITYVTSDGSRIEAEVEKGYSVMEGAINNNVDGIVAECGGACACATCHSLY